MFRTVEDLANMGLYLHAETIYILGMSETEMFIGMMLMLSKCHNFIIMDIARLKQLAGIGEKPILYSCTSIVKNLHKDKRKDETFYERIKTQKLELKS